MGRIFLNGMEFHAYHGCLPEEKKYGNTFIVDMDIALDMTASKQSDELNDTLNYADVYELVRQEMSISSNLIEHVCNRILERTLHCFPRIQRAGVKISKLNPPMMGKLHSVAVSMEAERNATD